MRGWPRGGRFHLKISMTLTAMGLVSFVGVAHSQEAGDISEQEVIEACQMLHPIYRQECIDAGGPRARLERRRAERRAAPYVPEGLAPESLRYNGRRRSASRDGNREYKPEGLPPETLRYNGPARSASGNRDRPYVPEGLPPETLRYNGPARSASRDADRPYVPEGLPPETLRYNGPARSASSDKNRAYVPEGLPPETLRYNGPARSASSGKKRDYVPEGLPPETLRYNGATQSASRNRDRAYVPEGLPPESTRYNGPGRPAPAKSLQVSNLRFVGYFPNRDARIASSGSMTIGQPSYAERVAVGAALTPAESRLRSELERMFPGYRGSIKWLFRLNKAGQIYELWAEPFPTDSRDTLPPRN
jgi:hypothetical protein